jgi:amphi-Trp domain-containing protein
MSDVKVERKESVSRQDAAEWLELLAKAFAEGGHAELQFGPDVVSMRVPDRMRAEFEVEVEGHEVEVELEFKWSTAPSTAAPPDRAEPVPANAHGHTNGARGSARSPRPRRR